jgi:hypothetical protein
LNEQALQIEKAIHLAENHELIVDKYFALMKEIEALKNKVIMPDTFLVSVKDWDLLFKGLPMERKLTLVTEIAGLRRDFAQDEALIIQLNFLENLIYVQQSEAEYEQRWDHLKKLERVLNDIAIQEVLCTTPNNFLQMFRQVEKLALISDKQFFLARIEKMLMLDNISEPASKLLTLLQQCLNSPQWIIDDEIVDAAQRYVDWTDGLYEMPNHAQKINNFLLNPPKTVNICSINNKV